ncbi:MAG: FN3 associated domain-containing protein, partial [Lutispora sp.]|nr:FN3 associated domain-containing protein [Lutispora sp.]
MIKNTVRIKSMRRINRIGITWLLVFVMMLSNIGQVFQPDVFAMDLPRDNYAQNSPMIPSGSTFDIIKSSMLLTLQQDNPENPIPPETEPEQESSNTESESSIIIETEPISEENQTSPVEEPVIEEPIEEEIIEEPVEETELGDIQEEAAEPIVEEPILDPALEPTGEMAPMMMRSMSTMSGEPDGSVDNPIPLALDEMQEIQFGIEEKYYTITAAEAGNYYARTYSPTLGDEAGAFISFGHMDEEYNYFVQDGTPSYADDNNNYYINYDRINLNANEQKLLRVYAASEGYVRFNVYKEFTPEQVIPSKASGVYTGNVGVVILSAQEGMDIYWDYYDWGTNVNYYGKYNDSTEIIDPASLCVIVKDPVTGLQSDVLELSYQIVDGIIVPSSEQGSTGGLSISFDEETHSKRVLIDNTTAGNEYSILIYNSNNTPIDYETTKFDSWLRDQNGENITSSGWAPVPNGVPKIGFTAEEGAQYFLDVYNQSSNVGDYIFKVFLNPPTSPIPSPQPPSLENPFTVPATVTLSADSGANIYYALTTDNYGPWSEEPAPVFMEYSSGITLDRNSVIYAYATLSGINSAVSDYYYNFEGPSAPTFTPSYTTQTAGTRVYISGGAEGDTIFYTDDGSDPYNSPTQITYTPESVITVMDGLRIRAIIKNSNGIYGYEDEITYKSGLPLPELTNKTSDNIYTLPYAAQLSTSVTGGSILYTLDDTDPKSGITYSDPISITKNAKLRAVVKLGEAYSEELIYDFTVTDARAIDLDTEYDGYVPIGQSEWFEFNITEPGKYSIEVIPDTPSYFDYLYNPLVLTDNAKIELSYSGYIDGKISLVYSFTVAGKYYAKVTASYNSSEKYKIQVKTLISPPTPNIESNTTVQNLLGLVLSSNAPGAEIFYTLDDSTPTTGSTKYTEPISISADGWHTVSAIAVVNRGTASEQISDVGTYYYYVASTMFSSTYGINYYKDYSNYTFVAGSTYKDSRYYIKIDSGYIGDFSNVKYYITPEGQSEIYLGESAGGYVTWDASSTPYTGSADLKAVAYDAAGNSGEYTININIKMAPPTVPTNLVATPDEGKIKLTWDASTGNTDIRYEIYRGTSSENMEYLGEVYYYSPTSYTDIILDNLTYYYKVRAIDENYFMSGFSQIVSAQATADTEPPAIEFDSYTISDDDFVNSIKDLALYLTDNVNLKNIKIEVSPTSDVDWQAIKDESISGSNTYYPFKVPNTFADGEYNIKATVTDAYDLTATDQIKVNLDNTPPAAPVLAASGMPGRVKLTYNKSVEGMYTTYKIYYAPAGEEFNSNDFYNAVESEALDYNETTITHFDHIGKEFKYKIHAIDRAGNISDASNIVSAVVGDYAPDLSITPDGARPGEVLTFTATGFRPWEAVYLYVDNAKIADLYADAEGIATYNYYTIPDNLTGVHSFKAQGSLSGVRSIKSYTVLSYVPTINVSSANPKAGETITITASGFMKVYFGFEYIKLYINDVSIGYPLSADEEGNYSYNYTIPYTYNGVLNIKLEGETSKSIAETSIAIIPYNPQITITPAGVGAGGSVTIAATGFAPNEALYLYLGDSTSGSNYGNTDSNGEKSFNYNIPALSSGSIVFKVKGSTSSLEASANYTVVSTGLGLEGPTTGKTGQKLTFTLSNFPVADSYYMYINGVYKSSQYAYPGDTKTYEYTPLYTDVGNMTVDFVGNTHKHRVSSIINIALPDGIAPSLTVIAPDGYTNGKTVTLTAGGFLNGETVKLYENGVYKTEKIAGVDGKTESYEYTLTSDGPFVFTAYGLTTGLTASANSGVDLNISHSGESYKPGDSVSLTISGLAADEAVYPYFNGKTIAGSYTGDGSGNLAFIYKLPYTTSAGLNKLSFNSQNGKHGEISVTVISPTPSISISPADISPGTEISISLSCFAPNEVVNLTIAGLAANDVTVDGIGENTFSYTVPLNAVGTNNITAKGSTSGFIATKAYIVSPIEAGVTVVPSESLPSSSVTISFSGFASSEKVSAYMDYANITPADLAADINGSGSFTYTIPASISSGDKTVTVRGLTSGRSASACYKVISYAPSISITPESIKAGDTVTISITGFGANDNIKFYFDNKDITSNIIGTAATDESGSLNVDYKLSSYLAEGNYTFKAIGSMGGVKKEITVNISAAVAKVRAVNEKGYSEGKVGTTVYITGENFESNADVAIYFDNTKISVDGSKTDGAGD